jgi:hypothetical protein
VHEFGAFSGLPRARRYKITIGYWMQIRSPRFAMLARPVSERLRCCPHVLCVTVRKAPSGYQMGRKYLVSIPESEYDPDRAIPVIPNLLCTISCYLQQKKNYFQCRFGDPSKRSKPRTEPSRLATESADVEPYGPSWNQNQGYSHVI